MNITGKVELVKSTFKWMISNDILCQQPEDTIYSPLFTTMADTELTWRLSLHRRRQDNHKDVKTTDSLSLGLVLYNNQETEVKVRFSLRAFGEGKSLSISDLDSTVVFTKECSEYGIDDFVPRNLIIDKANNTPIHKNLTITCRISWAQFDKR